MNYLVIKNVPISNLIERNSDNKLQWGEYGLCPVQIQRLQKDDSVIQGHIGFDGVNNVYTGDHVSIIAIKDDDKLQNKMAELQAKIDSNGIDGDSIEILDEADTDLTDLRSTVQTVRATAKAAFA